MRDRFKIEREFILTAIKPTLVNNDYANEWERKKQELFDMVKRYNETEAQLEKEEAERYQKNPSYKNINDKSIQTDFQSGSYQVVNSGTNPQINSDDLIEVP